MFNFWDSPLGRYFRGLPPKPPPLFVPVYRTPIQLFISEPGIDGSEQRQPLNPQDFVDYSTAIFLASKYNAALITQTPGGAGGPISVPVGVVEYWGLWNETVPFKLNLGHLAYYYWPAGGVQPQATVENPDLAVIQCNAVLDAARMDAQRKVR